MILTKFKNYFLTKVYQPLLGFLKEGTSPEKLAQSVAFGFIMGIFPILGTTTIICIALAFVFRLNHAAIQIVNYAAYPIQLTVLVPFIQLGLLMTGSSISSEKIDEVITLLSEDVWGAIGEVGYIVLSGALGWLIFAIPVYAVVYFVFLRIFRNVTS